jgi:exopolysaccharide biosynthesis polyprenyl glycosylphosphotransferase
MTVPSTLNETTRRRVAMLRWSGLLALAWFGAVALWRTYGGDDPGFRIYSMTLLWGAGAFTIAALLLDRFLLRPNAEGPLILLGVSSLPFAVLVIAFGAVHAPFSRLAIGLSWIATSAWLALGYQRYIHAYVLRLAVLEEKVYHYLTQALQGGAPRYMPVDLVQAPGVPRPDDFDGVVIDRFLPKSDAMRRTLARLKLANMRIYSAESVYELTTGRVSLPHVEDSFMDDAYGQVLYALFKRLVDIVGAVVLGAALAPLLVMVAALIRLESRGPALFVQERVGQGGIPFRMWKLRTMRLEASTDTLTTTDDDPRITRLGKRLRQYRIDELPQIWNVLRGDMSFIGPRPEWTESAQSFFESIPHYHYRHLVKPGISGWAQVNQGHVTDVTDAMIKLEYDLYYVKHLSISLDLVIAAKTLRTVLTGFGAR